MFTREECCIWICYIYVMYHFRTEVTLLRNNKRKPVGFGAAICFVVFVIINVNIYIIHLHPHISPEYKSLLYGMESSAFFNFYLFIYFLCCAHEYT